jgi:hypothetical protein
MARQNRDTKAIDNTVARNRLRSSLFHWMVKRHDELAERWGDGKVDWRTACEEFVELGLTDTRGRAATERNARETWLQARKHVAAKRAKAAAQAPRPVHPSRIDKEWRPANAPLPSAPNVPRLAGPPGLQNQIAPIRKGSVQPDGYDPEEQMAHLFRTVRQRSGRE